MNNINPSYDTIFRSFCDSVISVQDVITVLYLEDSVWNMHQIGALLSHIAKKERLKERFVWIVRSDISKINVNTMYVLKTFVHNLFFECFPTTALQAEVTEYIESRSRHENVETVTYDDESTYHNLFVNYDILDVQSNNELIDIDNLFENDGVLDEQSNNTQHTIDLDYPSPNNDSDQNKDIICKICYINKIGYVFKQCGHVICENCMFNVELTQMCPFCRTTENTTMKLYL